MKNINSVALFNRTDAQLVSIWWHPWNKPLLNQVKGTNSNSDGAGEGEANQLSRYTDDGIVVHSGGVVTVFQDGVEIEPLKEWIDKL